jgi:predicted transglutaminase-like cysteine proteinase
MRPQARGWCVYGLLALVSCAAGQGCAPHRITPGIAHVTAGPRPAPEAFAAFCRGAPKECARTGAAGSQVSLSPERWRELQSVNDHVNATVQEVSDPDQFGAADVWSLPVNGKGDCEDFALLKRKLLIERGWPSSALLLTVAADAGAEGHAVLTAVTDKGDYILDNRTSRIVPASAAPYTFFKRQSRADPAQWTALVPEGARVATAAELSRRNP